MAALRAGDRGKPRRMLLYAERPDVRARQVASDVAVPVAVAALVWLGTVLHDIVAALSHPATQVGDAAADVAATLEGVELIPIVGPVLAGPLGGIAAGSRELQSAAAAQAEQVLSVALIAGLLVAVPPAAWLVWRWLRARIAWSREASAAATLRDRGADLRVLALRATARAPLGTVLAGTTSDPWSDLVEGRAQPLIDQELDRLGLLPAVPR